MAYEDLLKDTSVADTSNNYFTLTITDLNPNTSYPIELRWKYKDGTFSNWSAVKRLAAKALIPAPPSLPSVPTLKRVVGAIEISWDGKTSNGANQPPTSFVDAEIYISTTSDFTPIKGGATNNYIDILDFANGQNTLNIGVGTVVNPSFTITYGIDYYVKIRSRNSENVYSSPVTANGSPIQVGQLGNAGLIEVKADKITTGILQSNSTITVGATNGKHVVIRGTGNPISIYGSGGSGSTENPIPPILDFDETGNLSIKGTINATSGAFTGAIKINGVLGDMKIGKAVGKTSDALGLTDPVYDGIYIGTNNYWYNDGIFEVGNGTRGLKWNGSNLIVKGEINSTSGSIGGFTIGENSIFASGLEIRGADPLYETPFGIASIRFNENYGIASGFGTLYIYNFVNDLNSITITSDNNVIVGDSTNLGFFSLKNIKVSTSDPSGGDNGDMWAKYV